MAKVGAGSESKLLTVNVALAMVVRHALKAAPPWLDFVVVSGRRTEAEQLKLWRKGRDEDGGIVDRDKIVTYKNGVTQLSRHQSGRAVDIAAYARGGISWNDEEVLVRAAYVIGFAAARGISLTGGVEWGWDSGHLELV